MACFDSGYCPDCGDCLDCYGDEYCAISGNLHDEHDPEPRPNVEPVATPNPEGVGDTPK